MSTATRRRKQAPQNPFDTSDIVDIQVERDCLAALIWTAVARPLKAAEVVETLTPEAFTVDWGAEIFRAIAASVKRPSPTISDVQAALKTEITRQAFDPVDALALLSELIEDKDVHGTGLEWKLPDTSARLAAEVLELHARRRAIAACQDAVRRARDGRPMPEELQLVAGQLTDVADLVAGRQTRGRRLRVRKASEIEPKPIEWLWPRRISRGSLTIITGLPGLSKTTLTYDIAARITTGGKWPDGTGSAPRGGVILFGMEDDPEKVVVPRLMAADADLELIRIVDGAEDGRRRDDSWLTPVSIDRDLALLREQLDAFPECRVIVFDPLSQFVEAEENSNAHTRAALAPLVNLAQERGVAVIGIMHMSKKTDSMMIQRIAGASSYGQIARHIIFVGNDTDDNATGLDRRRVMIVVKNSYGPSNCGQLYRVTTRRGDQPGIEWIAGTVERDAEALNPKPAGVSRDYQEQRGEAVDAMRELLAGGPRPSVEVEGALKSQGFRRRQIDYAADLLEIDKRQARGPDGRRAWLWSLPAGDAAEPDHELPTPHDAIPASEWRAH